MTLLEFIDKLNTLNCTVYFPPGDKLESSLTIRVEYNLLPPYKQHVMRWEEKVSEDAAYQRLYQKVQEGILNIKYPEVKSE